MKNWLLHRDPYIVFFIFFQDPIQLGTPLAHHLTFGDWIPREGKPMGLNKALLGCPRNLVYWGYNPLTNHWTSKYLGGS